MSRTGPTLATEGSGAAEGKPRGQGALLQACGPLSPGLVTLLAERAGTHRSSAHGGPQASARAASRKRRLSSGRRRQRCGQAGPCRRRPPPDAEPAPASPWIAGCCLRFLLPIRGAGAWTRPTLVPAARPSCGRAVAPASRPRRHSRHSRRRPCGWSRRG